MPEILQYAAGVAISFLVIGFIAFFTGGFGLGRITDIDEDDIFDPEKR